MDTSGFILCVKQLLYALLLLNLLVLNIVPVLVLAGSLVEDQRVFVTRVQVLGV